MDTRNEPTLAQYKATAVFHRRAEAAYRKAGQDENAAKARQAAEKLEAKVKELEQV